MNSCWTQCPKISDQTPIVVYKQNLNSTPGKDMCNGTKVKEGWEN